MNRKLSTQVVIDAQAGNLEAIEEVLDRVDPFIKKAVRKVGHTSLPKEDLEQDARLAVLEALPRFDASKGFSIETFLFQRIRGAVYNSAGSYYSGFSLDHNVLDSYFRAIREGDTEAEARSFAVSNGMSAEAFDGAHAAVTGVWGIDSEDSDEDEPSGYQVSTCDHQDAVVENLVLRDALDQLDERDRQVIVLAFGLDGGAELNDREIGEIIGIDRSRVNRVRTRGMSILDGLLKEEN